MHIRFQFESQLDENTLEDLFDTVATILPEDLYSEQTVLAVSYTHLTLPTKRIV